MRQKGNILVASVVATLLFLLGSPAQASYCDSQGSFFADEGPYIGGTVVDTETGLPAAGIRLLLCCCDTGRCYDETVTTADGEYSFGGETPSLGFWIGGCYDVRVEDGCFDAVDRVNDPAPNCPRAGAEDCFQFTGCDDDNRYRVDFRVRNLCGGDGCTPGYWKNHLCSWPDGYNPTDDFDSTFGVHLFDPDITLCEALRMGGGGDNRLARHGTAAILNAAHQDAGYPLSVQQVIALVQAGNADALENNNELGCPLGRCPRSLRKFRH